MKKGILALVMGLCLVVPGAALAASKILVPASKCETIQSASYSTGSGNQMIQYAKILCKKGNVYTLFMPQKMSKAGLMGKLTGSRTVGRMFSSDEIEIVITDKVDEAEFD